SAKEGQNHDTDLTAQSKIFIHDEMAPQPLAPPPKLRANHDQGSAIRGCSLFVTSGSRQIDLSARPGGVQ
ncbi:MAG TPA: hypothetical protein VLI39_18995, partial [Sedimentisphaerales bacterium]|nr:hypothetical protein [Sedimentisphaerales bacterium]